MRVIVLTKEGTDYSRAVDTFIDDFARQTGKELERMDPESLEGEQFCRAYDILQFPSVIAISNDGQVQNLWLGGVLPTISEVSFYAFQD